MLHSAVEGCWLALVVVDEVTRAAPSRDRGRRARASSARDGGTAVHLFLARQMSYVPSNSIAGLVENIGAHLNHLTHVHIPRVNVEDTARCRGVLGERRRRSY